MTAATPFWERYKEVDGCWVWTGSTGPNGYGKLSRNRGWNGLAHRVAYSLVHGGIPEGLVIDHLCRNRACINPAHLEAVTFNENVRRGARNYGGVRTRCKYGHDITVAENLITLSNGTHRCRLCKHLDDAHQRRNHAGPRGQCPFCENETFEERVFVDGEDS